MFLLERRIKLWNEGNIEGLLYEGMTILQRLRSDKEGMAVAKISLKFKNLMGEGNVNRALKFLIDNMHSRILPLNKETLELTEKYINTRTYKSYSSCSV